MPLLWLSIAFLVGVWLSQLFNWPAAWWGAVAILALLALVIRVVLARRFHNLPGFTVRLANPDDFPASELSIFLILFCLAFGGWRCQISQPKWDAEFIGSYNDLESESIVQGVVARPPDKRDKYTLLTLGVENVQTASAISPRRVSGLLLARVVDGREWAYGDRVAVQGELVTPATSEEFSYRDYLARHGIYAYMSNASASLAAHGQGSRPLAWIYALRERSLRSLYALFPDPEAGLLAGILLGIETGIPASVNKAFQDSGTAHIIAISGFNMAIVAGLFAALFGRLLGKRRGALAALAAIVLYTLLVGASPPVVRAAIMSGMAVFAAQVGRRGNGLNTLAIVAALMALIDPNVIWDVGFQLSFMATLGLVLYAGPLMDGFARLAGLFLSKESARRLAQPVGEYVLFTLAALILTLPISVYYFHRLPLASLLANPLVLPVQPAVMIVGGLAMLVGMLSLPAGQVVAYLAWPLVAYTIRMAEFWASFKNTILHFGPVSGLAVGLFYLFVFLLTFTKPLQRSQIQPTQPGEAGEATRAAGGLASIFGWFKRSARPLLGLTLAGLGLLTVLVWRAVAANPDGRLHLTVLDVGSGEAILLQTPGGRNLLIDGGSSPTTLSDALGRRLPLGMRRLDYLIVAGTEDDQVGALPGILERYPAGRVLWAGPSGGTRSAQHLSEFLAKIKTTITAAEIGQVIDLGDGASLEVVSANRRGSALLLEFRNFRALLPISLDSNAVEALQADPELAAVPVMLLSDGGYAPANPPALIQKLQPQLILLSVAAGNRRNLPDGETLQAAQGYSLLRTDQNGWIEVATDGDQMWVEVERK